LLLLAKVSLSGNVCLYIYLYLYLYIFIFIYLYISTKSLQTLDNSCCEGEAIIRVWSFETKTHICNLKGHTGTVTDIRIYEKEVISASDDGNIRAWSVTTGQEIRNMHSSVFNGLLLSLDSTVAWSNSIVKLSYGKAFIIGGGNQGQLSIWDRETGTRRKSY
jgi:WD40 repeat protein